MATVAARRVFVALTLSICLSALAACGGNMGSDPSSGSRSTPASSSSGSTPPGSAGGNASPSAAAGSVSGASYSSLSGTLNGSNPCRCGTLEFAVVSPPAHGSLTLTDASTGAFSYMPDPGFAGNDSFRFTFSNGQATSASATETLTVTAPAIGALDAPANIGVNLDGISYYSITQPFVDMMRMSGSWKSTSSDTTYGANQDLARIGMLDAKGWPKEDASIMVVCCTASDGSAADPGTGSPLYGSYQLSFNGKAVLHALSSTITDQQYDTATNATTATVNILPANQGKATLNNVALTFSNTQRTASAAVNTGITNVHLIRPQFAPNGAQWWDSPSQEFTDPFLASLAPFSTLRFMDWEVMNGNQVADWDQRTPPGWVGPHEIETDGAWEWNPADQKVELTNNWWSTTGVSWQSMIDLANTTGKDMWINIPVRATDDYVTQLAALIKQQLDPGLHVYVEYSNEVWNSSFEQWSYNNAALAALLADNPTEAANYQNNCVGWANNICHVAERAMQISNDFAAVWGSPAIGTTVRPVFCSQAVNPGAAQIALAFINNSYGPPSKYFYGICGAPYWSAAVSAGESVDDLLAASAADIPQSDSYLLGWTAAARYYGLRNFTYEGGTGMTDRNSVDTPNLITANADPRMGQQVTQALTGAFQNGVDMYMYFTSSGAWSKYGAWGATPDILDLTQPKWQALQALAGKSITRTLAVVSGSSTAGIHTPGTALPGTIDAGQPQFGVVAGSMRPTYQADGFCSAAANGLPDVCTLRGGQAQGNGEYGYLVTAAQAGNYTVTLKMDSRGTQSAATAQFYVNQQAQGGSINIPAAPKGTPSRPAAFSITLPAGISLVELEATSGSLAVDSIQVSQ